eukprot:gene14330-21981_t
MWQAMYTIGNWTKPLPSDVPEGLSAALVDFLHKCFKPVAVQRSTAAELLEHHWLNHLESDDETASSDDAGTSVVAQKLSTLITRSSFIKKDATRRASACATPVPQPDWLHTCSSLGSTDDDASCDPKPAEPPPDKPPNTSAQRPAHLPHVDSLGGAVTAESPQAAAARVDSGGVGGGRKPGGVGTAELLPGRADGDVDVGKQARTFENFESDDELNVSSPVTSKLPAPALAAIGTSRGKGSALSPRAALLRVDNPPCNLPKRTLLGNGSLRPVSPLLQQASDRTASFRSFRSGSPASIIEGNNPLSNSQNPSPHHPGGSPLVTQGAGLDRQHSWHLALQPSTLPSSTMPPASPYSCGGGAQQPVLGARASFNAPPSNNTPSTNSPASGTTHSGRPSLVANHLLLGHNSSCSGGQTSPSHGASAPPARQLLYAALSGGDGAPGLSAAFVQRNLSGGLHSPPVHTPPRCRQLSAANLRATNGSPPPQAIASPTVAHGALLSQAHGRKGSASSITSCPQPQQLGQGDDSPSFLRSRVNSSRFLTSPLGDMAGSPPADVIL